MRKKLKFLSYVIIGILLYGLLVNINFQVYLPLSVTSAISIILFRMRCNTIRPKKQILGIFADATCGFIPIINGLALVFSVYGLFMDEKQLYKVLRLELNRGRY